MANNSANNTGLMDLDASSVALASRRPSTSGAPTPAALPTNVPGGGREPRPERNSNFWEGVAPDDQMSDIVDASGAADTSASQIRGQAPALFNASPAVVAERPPNRDGDLSAASGFTSGAGMSALGLEGAFGPRGAPVSAPSPMTATPAGGDTAAPSPILGGPSPIPGGPSPSPIQGGPETAVQSFVEAQSSFDSPPVPARGGPGPPSQGFVSGATDFVSGASAPTVGIGGWGAPPAGQPQMAPAQGPAERPQMAANLGFSPGSPEGDAVQGFSAISDSDDDMQSRSNIPRMGGPPPPAGGPPAPPPGPSAPQGGPPAPPVGLRQPPPQQQTIVEDLSGDLNMESMTAESFG